MKTIFDTTLVSKDEYIYFKQLKVKEQIQYFFELYDSLIQENGGNAMDLGSFFASVKSSLESQDERELIVNLPDDWDRVDIVIDDKNILIESDSLRAIKEITAKFMESGYILRRDVDLEKSFRKDKVTRYLRIFRIISQASHLCFN
jgi:hypothetical protein